MELKLFSKYYSEFFIDAITLEVYIQRKIPVLEKSHRTPLTLLK